MACVQRSRNVLHRGSTINIHEMYVVVYIGTSLLSLVHRLLTRHCPHLLLGARRCRSISAASAVKVSSSMTRYAHVDRL